MVPPEKLPHSPLLARVAQVPCVTVSVAHDMSG
jgi:hypothetical protein